MKCFEKIMISFLKTEVGVFLDPFQFAYKCNRSTEDAILADPCYQKTLGGF